MSTALRRGIPHRNSGILRQNARGIQIGLQLPVGPGMPGALRGVQSDRGQNDRRKNCSGRSF
jgi:hypothetical protein